MKFVCTECDEPMKFDQNGGLDEDGSMSATFRCPSCEWGVTLLINPQETQMVRSRRENWRRNCACSTHGDAPDPFSKPVRDYGTGKQCIGF